MFTIEDANKNKKIFELALQHGQLFQGWMTSESHCVRIKRICKDAFGLKLEKEQAIKIIYLVSNGGQNYWNPILTDKRTVARTIVTTLETKVGAELKIRGQR